MDTLSWFKFCPAKWNMGKTRKLTPEQRDEYLDLCSSYWVGGCVMTLDDMRTHSDCIDLFLRRGLVSEDGIEWLNVQYEQVASKSSKARQAAKKRWSESERNADAMRTHSDGNASAMQRDKIDKIDKKDKIDEKEREKVQNVVLPWDTDSFRQIWETWCKFRTKELRKRKYQPVGEQAALKNLAELAGGWEPTAHKIIEQSIANGWQGLFELKTNNTRKNGVKEPTEDELDVLKEWVRTGEVKRA